MMKLKTIFKNLMKNEHADTQNCKSKINKLSRFVDFLHDIKWGKSKFT